MLTPDLASLRDVQARMVALGEHAHDGDPASAWLSRIDNLLPAALISTTEWATKDRLLPGPTGNPVKWDLARTPYAAGIQDACDMHGVSVVGVKASARWAKTVAAENKVGKNWSRGPSVNVLWLMQTKDDLADYVDERVTWMLENHEEISSRIDWSDSRNGRFRMQIGESIAFWRPATMKSLRGKSAPLIIADEIDAYEKRVRRALLTLVKNRQREHGANALAYFCSHPDAGPTEGIDAVIADGLKHLWYAPCPHCGEAVSPAKEAEERGDRIVWNVSNLLERAEEMERQELLDMIAREVVLVCPHHGCLIGEEERFPMMAKGCWIQPGQKLEKDGTVSGTARVHEIMGFIGHGFMSPFVTLGQLARAWAAAWLHFSATGDDTALREETVKSLGETYEGGKAEEQIDNWKVAKARLTAAYALRTVPTGVLFLTAFVDVQGDRFEVRVIGWNLAKQSWLIDAFAIKQWPGFDNIDPGNRLKDWDIIEEAVLMASYPLARDPDLYLPIARIAVNAAGSPGVTNNARVWLSNMLARKIHGHGRIVESYRVLLFQGSAHKEGETYGRPKPVMHDDAGKQLEVQIYERVPIVHKIKRIIAARMKIEEGPGRMHLPAGTADRPFSDRYIRELVAECLVNGDWVATGRNETWDGWVAAELARATLQPDRPGLWDTLPEWASPLPRGQGLVGESVAAPANFYDRLAQYNRSIGGE